MERKRNKKIYKAKSFNKDDLEPISQNTKKLYYITRTGENNGCELVVSDTNIPIKNIENGNAISIGDTTATCFYQSSPFITGDHMVVIRTEWLNKYTALFILTLLQKEQYKYSYGRAYLMSRISDTYVKLPIQHNSDGTIFIDETHTYSEKVMSRIGNIWRTISNHYHMVIDLMI